MIEHTYTLEKGSRKFTCPHCGQKRFVKYVNTETGEYLPDEYGRCDRESKCSYHLNPYKDGYAIDKEESSCKLNRVSELITNKQNTSVTKSQGLTKGVIPDDVLSGILKDYEQNAFIRNLSLNIPFPVDKLIIQEIIELYCLGTIAKGYRKGAVAFPFMDNQDVIRAIQVKQFDKNNHTTGTDFLHSMLEKHYVENNLPKPEWLEDYLMADKKVSCLFGEHLLDRYPTNIIALVEAPKTAIIGALYFGMPDIPSNLLWLAVYNKSSFSFDKVEVLKGRNIIVFPDLSKNGETFKEWAEKAKLYESKLPGTKFSVSDLLERGASKEEKEKGLDLADYLLRLDWRAFRLDGLEESPNEMELAEIEKINRRTAS